MDYKKIELENGIRVASLSMPHMESISLGICIKAGSRYESKETSGISHFLEHLVFRGTKKRTAHEIKKSIEGLGGLLNAFTAEEFTCYFVKIPSKHIELSLDVLSDMVLNALLEESDVEKERKVILEEIKMYMDLPMHYVQELLNSLLWSDHPLGMFISGSLESVSRLKREEIVSYRDRFYQPQNINVIVCGALDINRFLELTEEYFSFLKPGKKISFQRAKVKQNRVQTKFLIKDTEQTHVSLGVHGLPRTHKDRYTLSLLHIILGANMSSRLFQEVREKRGLAYEIGTMVKKFQDTGAFIVNAGVEHKKAKEAIKVIMEELIKIKRRPVSKNELKRAKEYFSGQFLLALEDTMDHMLWLGENVTMLDRIYSPQEVLEKMNKTKIEDIQSLANEIFQKNDLNLALIGKISDEDRVEIERNLEI